MATISPGLVPAPFPSVALRSETWRRWWPYAAILLAAFLIRLPMLGNPVPEPDEQLYLLIGDRMLHGQLPYVDLWDRKPIGLFLFYAAVRTLGGTGIVQYQCAATVCAAATAGLIHAIARRRSGPFAALAAAIGYLLILTPLRGGGGQAPVLYNVLTAIAAHAAYRANDGDDPRRIVRLGLLAMAAMGLAIQFKYTPVVEGMFFGAYFLWRLRQSGWPPARLGLSAAAMIAVALLPTLAAIGFYATTGHLDAFVQANFLSIFGRAPFPPLTRLGQRLLVLFFAGSLLALMPFGLVALWRTRRRANSRDAGLTLGWLIAALAGFGMLGEFYDFYFITVLPPLLVLAAPLVRAGRAGFAAACLLLVWPPIVTPRFHWQTTRYRTATEAIAAAVRPYVRDRCLYVYDGPTILYLLTGACTPSRYVYPDHLTNPTEAPALGVDPVAEEARLLATRPGAIVTASVPLIPAVDPATQALVRDTLARDYVLVARIPYPERIIYVWALRALHPGPSPLRDRRAAIPA